MGSDFDAAWADWLAFLSSLGFAAEAHLRPPATEAELAGVEAEIGFALPADLRALYLLADGQTELRTIEDPAPGTTVAPLFGGYEFVSLSRATADYHVWEDVLNDWPQGHDPHAFITLRAGDPPVARKYWQRGWLPFAIDGGGNAYAVDLSPPPGGTWGQVIVIGSDEDERRVLAPSLAAFLAEAAAREPIPDEEDGHVRYFEME